MSFVYAVLTAQIVLWLLGVLAVISTSLSLFGISLFYTLVLAVEHIAYDRN